MYRNINETHTNLVCLAFSLLFLSNSSMLATTVLRAKDFLSITWKNKIGKEHELKRT